MILSRAVFRRSALMGLALTGLAACVAPPPDNKFVVFFTDQSVQLDEPAQAVVRQAAAAAARTLSAPVTVAGYADLPGSPQQARNLSLQRAQAVSTQLTSLGVAANRISLRPRGAGGEPGVESRRVEILVGP